MTDVPRWRTGTKVGRTLYIGDRLIGMVDNRDLAELIVRCVNVYIARNEPMLRIALQHDPGPEVLELLKLVREGTTDDNPGSRASESGSGEEGAGPRQ